MTNELKISRELVQRIADHCKFWKEHPYLEAISDIEPELRALLAAPAVERQPVARPWMDGCTEPRTYTEAKAQLADAMKVIVGLRDQRAEIAEKIKALCKHPSMSFHQVALLEGILSSGSEYASPPASVAVVLPERKVHQDHGLTVRDSEADGWNACLDKVKEMNQ